MVRQLLQNAAREGARQAIISTTTKTTAQIQAVVSGYLVNTSQLNNLNTQIYQVDSSGNNSGVWNNASFSQGIAVQVDTDVKSVFPNLGFMPGTFHLQVRSIMRCEAPWCRRGAVIPLAALTMVALCGFVALAVDVGMVAVAKTQAQGAADAAAFTATRSVDGSPSPNLTGATTNAQTSAAANPILSVPVAASDLAITYGAYHYDSGTQTFSPQYPPVAPDNYNLAQAVVTHRISTAFANVLGIASANVTATSVAAYRPRDVSIVLDFSGSMNNESDLWNCEAYLGAMINTPNNLDPIIPQFGHYSNIGAANLQCTSANPLVGKCNITIPALGIPAMVNDYYQSNRGASTISYAFTPASTSYQTTPGGDNFLFTNKNTTSTYATNVNDVTTNLYDSNFETKGYKQFTNQTFNGYTTGPGYWGKTFWVWPPDPTKDWRKQFFLKTGGSYPNFGGALNDNTLLWGPAFKNPQGNYVINYKAILNWIANSGANPFPPQLRGGRIMYYSAIPTDVPAAAYDHTQPNSSIGNADQRFWKEYIDYTLGVWRDPFGVVQPTQMPACSIGPDYNWGTVQISAPPTGSSNVPYMNYKDNPPRPRHRFWFGPMTMIQFMSDTKLLAGTAHDISMFPAKLGIAGALQDIENNHPNDMVSMILYSRPQYNNDPAGVGMFSQAQYNLSRNYAAMINSLWFPPNSSSLDVRPWDSNGVQTPRAFGDYCSNTATSYGMMLAYNQFSGNTTVRTDAVGGFGRVGAQRLVILETDGMANVDSVPVSGFANNGANNSYYHILPGDALNGANYSQNAVLQASQAIANKADGTAGYAPGYSPNPGYPGFSTTNKPVSIQTIAFGAIFEPTASGATAAQAVALLQQIASIGGTIFPSSSSDAANGYKWVIGTIDQRITKLQQAFSHVMDDGASVTLIQ